MAQLMVVNDAERVWVEGNVALVADSGVDLDDADALGRAFDAEAARWFGTPEGERGDPNALVNAFGLAVGEHLRRTCALHWVVASDDDGTEIALHRQPYDVLVHPTAMVARRWYDGTRGEVQALVSAVKDSLAGLPDDA
ncbi:MAG: DUF3806 domain-containing protein [Micrococcales bacterium]|nr:DUF3806 domain-containing protein [Micrococcales bacterium]